MRLASVLVVALVDVLSPNNRTWVAVVYAYGFSHYLMALVYSKRQAAEFIVQPLSWLSLVSIGLLGAGLYFSQFPLLFFFALHHAFNEAYVLKHTVPSDDQASKAFRTSAVLLHLFLYFVLLRHTQGIGHVDLSPFLLLRRFTPGAGEILNAEFLWIGLAGSYALFFYYLRRIRSSLDFRRLLEISAFELLGIVAVAASFYVDFKFLHVVLYHFVFWSLFPLPKMWTTAPRSIALYAGMTALLMAVFLSLSPIGPPDYRLAGLLFQEQFRLWSYIHITASFLLSNANPDWVIGLFRPAAGAVR
jgi:hypothetical protein